MKNEKIMVKIYPNYRVIGVIGSANKVKGRGSNEEKEHC